MSTGYQIKDQEGLYYLTFQVVDWIDIFTRQVYRDIVIDSFKYAINNKGFRLFAYVVMSGNKKYQVWTHENHAIYLYSSEFIAEKLEYLHQNPVRAGIVVNPEDYLYSSARNYTEPDNLLQVEILSLPGIFV